MTAEQTFNHVIRYFNEQDWGSIEDYLADGLMVKKVDDPDRVGPKRTLMNYLRGMDETPYMSAGTYHVQTLDAAHPKTVVISGQGSYVDDTSKQGQRPEAMAYTFTFSQDNKDNWLLFDVWAALVNSDGSIQAATSSSGY